MSHQAQPVGGDLWTPTTRWLLLGALVGGAAIAWRFASGLGAVTGMNDGHPWGLWIAMDVVTGTALACGGYAVALLAYVMNKGRYHPLVRPALVTSLLGYALGTFGVMIDLGRPWFVFKLFTKAPYWNFSSVLLEVALCISLYTVVLFIELLPAFLEGGAMSKSPGIKNFSEKLLPVMEKTLVWFIALGVLLPTMHQSSLGALMMLAGSKLHGLWHSPWLPFLFLVSCIGMGYAAVIFEGVLSARAFKRPLEMELLGRLSGPITLVLVLFVVVRFVDLAIGGKMGLLFSSGAMSVAFWVEIVLFLAPAAMLMSKKTQTDPTQLFRTAMLIMFGGALYRFDTFLVAYFPGQGWGYFPAVPEILATVGLISVEVLLYVWIVRRFPILASGKAAGAKA